MTTGLRAAESSLAALDALAEADLTAQELLDETASRIQRVVPSDGFLLGATDPQTSLCIGPGVVHDLPEDQCQPTWDFEFHVPDVMKFTDIARSSTPVACLHEQTGGRPERSPRWRAFSSATGFRSELRATFSLGTGVWGIAQFDRFGDSARFSEDERAWLARVAPVVARGLRRAMVSQPSAGPAGRGPGILILDRDNRIVSTTPEADAWLEQMHPATNLGWEMPFEAHVFIGLARAALEGDRPAAVPPARMRVRDGSWLLMHASMLRGGDELAVVVEPAGAADVAPLIVAAYGLTQRELEVTRAIARGLGTGEIAAELSLSAHTVRDHVKAVFEKTGVTSRGELVAKVFADHYSRLGHAA